MLKVTSVGLIITALQARFFACDRCARLIKDLKTARRQYSRIAVFKIHKSIRDLPEC